jgi:hypothetical protein
MLICGGGNAFAWRSLSARHDVNPATTRAAVSRWRRFDFSLRRKFSSGATADPAINRAAIR